MVISRRDIMHMMGVVGFSSVLPSPAWAQSAPANFSLPNGLRVHCRTTASSYISAALTLRSQNIMGPGGLAHILEHTSFTGAAGPLSAKEVKDRHKSILHDSNALTGPGVIQWHASFLPKYTSEALALFAITSFDQKFDVETVASEARIVLQELYLDKYASEGAVTKRFTSMLYGAAHPYARETTDVEIAKAKTPPALLSTRSASACGPSRPSRLGE